MCRPPSVVTLPGHHGTFGLRISRALVRMNRNDEEERCQENETLALSMRVEKVLGQLKPNRDDSHGRNGSAGAVRKGVPA